MLGSSSLIAMNPGRQVQISSILRIWTNQAVEYSHKKCYHIKGKHNPFSTPTHPVLPPPPPLLPLLPLLPFLSFLSSPSPNSPHFLFPAITPPIPPPSLLLFSYIVILNVIIQSSLLINLVKANLFICPNLKAYKVHG